MLTIVLKNNLVLKFNLKDFKTEKRLYHAWFSMHDDEKYKNKKFKIITDTGKNISLFISEIKNCEFDEKMHLNL